MHRCIGASVRPGRAGTQAAGGGQARAQAATDDDYNTNKLGANMPLETLVIDLFDSAILVRSTLLFCPRLTFIQLRRPTTGLRSSMLDRHCRHYHAWRERERGTRDARRETDTGDTGDARLLKMFAQIAVPLALETCSHVGVTLLQTESEPISSPNSHRLSTWLHNMTA